MQVYIFITILNYTKKKIDENRCKCGLLASGAKGREFESRRAHHQEFKRLAVKASRFFHERWQFVPPLRQLIDFTRERS